MDHNSFFSMHDFWMLIGMAVLMGPMYWKMWR